MGREYVYIYVPVYTVETQLDSSIEAVVDDFYEGKYTCHTDIAGSSHGNISFLRRLSPLHGTLGHIIILHIYHLIYLICRLSLPSGHC